MTPLLQLSCAMCGRPVSVAPAERPSLPRCERCLRKMSGASQQYQVDTLGSQLLLDRPGVITRLRTGEIRPTDFVAAEDEAARPVAAHPDFRTLFMPGHPDFLAPPEKPRVPPPKWLGPLLRWGGIATVLGGAGLWVATHPPELPSLSDVPRVPSLDGVLPGEPPPPESPGPQVAIADATVPNAARVPGPIDGLVERIGPVSEPRNLLHARAWNARFEGGGRALEAAIADAERAVARLPDDANALALLSELYAEAGREPELRKALLSRAKTVDREAIAVYRAAVAMAVADGSPSDVAAASSACLAADPKDRGCRYHALRGAAAEADPSVTLARWDELVAAWPVNREVARRAGVHSAAADLPDAHRRLSGLRKVLKDDPQLEGAWATLAYRDDDAAAGDAVTARLGAAAPEDLVVSAAAAAVARGDANAALGWLRGRTFTGFGLARRAALHEAQAHWMLARAGGSIPDAVAAAARLAEKGESTSASLQVRALIANLAGDTATEARVWALADTRGRPSRDDARLHLAHAWVDLLRKQPRDALSYVEMAQRSDPHSADVYVWLGLIQLASHNPNGAFEAMRDAVRQADGTDARRSELGAALRVSSPWKELRDKFGEVVGRDVTLQASGAFARATASWLGGDDAGALAELGPHLSKTDDAEAMALAARIHFRRGNLASAAELAGRVSRIRPKEGAYHLLYAQILARQGKWPEAEGALGVVRSGGATGPIYTALFAEAALARGDRGSALISAREALRLDPSDVVARRLLRKIAAGA